MNPVIAAGFVEITDAPQAFLTAVVSSLAYSSFLFLPVFHLARRSKEQKRKKEAILALILTLAAPFAVREAAVIIMSPYWRDWHFIWLYLMASTLIMGTCHLIVYAWRIIQKRKGQPDGTDNSGASPLRV